MRTAIRSGLLDQGYKMPPVRELAWQLGITPGTVARAYKMAAEEGLVETAVGRGTFVSGAMVTEEATPTPLIHPKSAGGLDFRAIRVPNCGQDAAIRRIMAGMAARDSCDMIDYPTPETDYEARDAVVGWVEPERVGRFGPDEVILGLGAQNAVNVVLQTVLHGTTPVILTEELAYPGWRHAARLLRAEIIGIEMDGEGIRPDRFEEALRRYGAQVLITAAEVQSPTTTRTTLARRQEIARLARKYQVQIIEDDCHCITRPEIPNYRALCPERGWYISSLTKAVSAGAALWLHRRAGRTGGPGEAGGAIDLLRVAAADPRPVRRADFVGRGGTVSRLGRDADSAEGEIGGQYPRPMGHPVAARCAVHLAAPAAGVAGVEL